MPKITDEELTLIPVRLFTKDLAVLRRLYKGQFGVNRAIRTIVRSFVAQSEAKANAVIDENETISGEAIIASLYPNRDDPTSTDYDIVHRTTDNLE